MYGLFNDKESIIKGVICTNLLQSLMVLLKITQSPDNSTEFFIDAFVHILTACLLDDPAPANAKRITALTNAIRIGAIVGAWTSGNYSLSFIAGVTDALFHFANVTLLLSEDLTNSDHEQIVNRLGT